MKSLILLVSLFSLVCSAQLKQTEFENAMLLLQGKESEKALTNLEDLEKKFPTDEQVILLRGFYQFRDGNLNAAMMSFSNAIKANPKYAFAYGARAQLFSTKGMFDKAILDISEALKIEPQNIDFLKTRVTFYFENKQFKEALEDAKFKIRLEPNNIMNYFDAADFSKYIDKNTDADDFFNQAYANKEIPKYVTDVLFAKFLLRYGRFDESKNKYETALATNEKDFGDEDLHDAAIAFYKTKNYDKSILYFNKAISMNPNNVTYYNNFISVYMDLKDWQKVKEIAEKALSVDANDPMANMLMAVGLKFTGNESLALEYQNKANRLEAEQKN